MKHKSSLFWDLGVIDQGRDFDTLPNIIDLKMILVGNRELDTL
jgi:hypothetical protein